MGVYVYAITSGGHPLRLEGVTGVGDPPGEVRTVTAEGLAAVVSEAPQDLRAKRRDLQAHQAVLEQIMADGSLLPLQFGAVAADEEAVRQLLQERADVYRTRLTALEGCAEFNLKASAEEDALLWDILERSETARKLNEDIRAGRGGQDAQIMLGELVGRDVQDSHEAYAAQVVDTLGPLARDYRLHEAGGDDFVNVSFLVDTERIDDFTTAAAALGKRFAKTLEAAVEERFGEVFSFRLNGPLPPYSFV